MKKKGNKRKHLNEKERFVIEAMIKAKNTYKEIALGLNRGISTIKKEVGLNGGKSNYTASKAHKRALRKQYYKKKDCNKVVTRFLIKSIEKKLQSGASPEAISGNLKERSSRDYISAKSIRKFIKSRSSLERFLFWQKTKKKSGRKRSKNKDKLSDDRVFIDQRPVVTGTYGHYEGDFIVSKQSKYVLLVIVEMLTKHTMIRLLPNRINTSVNRAITEMLKGKPVKSFTFDNDIALKKWRELEKSIKAPVFFTHPYCSWEKGLVENTNRWIRSFIPKRTDLRSVSKKNIQDCLDWLNFLPRRCIDYKIPTLLMVEYEGKVLSDLEKKKVSIWG